MVSPSGLPASVTAVYTVETHCSRDGQAEKPGAQDWQPFHLPSALVFGAQLVGHTLLEVLIPPIWGTT